MADIQLRDVSRVFGQVDSGQKDGAVVALDHVDLVIPDGTTLAVVGPSGCGKTTLLRVIAGLDRAYTGEVLYDGRSVRDLSPKERRIGVVFQNYALYPHFRGRGNLSFFFKVRRAPSEEAERRIRATSKVMGLGFKQILRHRPGQLSGGGRQRLAVARALVRDPQLLLFDEPLSNLDAKLRTQTRTEIKRLLHQFAITTVYVTHDQIEAMALGDELAVMRSGAIEQVGPYDELKHQPTNMFVAGFIGPHAMNLFDGWVVADGQVRMDEIRMPIPPALRTALERGQRVALGVSPEHVHVPADRSGDGYVRLQGEVEAVEPDYGDRQQLIYFGFRGATYRAMGPLAPSLGVGDPVTVSFSTGHVHFFDQESGRRLG